MSIVLLRHAQPEIDNSGRVQPHDNPLSTIGQEQAKEVANKLIDFKFDLIICSPYQRAKQTAEIIGKELVVEVIINNLLKERSQGILEDQNVSDEEIKLAWEKFEQFKILSEKEQWKSRPFEGFESDQELLDRGLKGLDEIRNNYDDKSVLVVTHAGLVKTILIHYNLIELAERDNVKINFCEYFKID